MDRNHVVLQCDVPYRAELCFGGGPEIVPVAPLQVLNTYFWHYVLRRITPYCRKHNKLDHLLVTQTPVFLEPDIFFASYVYISTALLCC